MSLDKLQQAICHIRTEIDKKDMPAYWIEFLLIVADAGDDGITTVEAAKLINMTQGIASRTVKLLSSYYDETNKVLTGPQILKTKTDLQHRHRQRVLLSEKGKQMMEEVKRIMGST